MNRLKFIFIQFFCMSILFGGSQTVPKLKSSAESNEIICVATDFQFDVESRFYRDGKTVFVCPKNLPIDVTVISTATFLPVTGVFVWRIDGVMQSETTHTIAIVDTDFTSPLIINPAEII